MKSLAVLLLLLSVSVSALAENPPELSAKAAVEIADKSLAERNLAPKVFIQSVAIQSTALLGGKRTWYVQWSGFVQGTKPGTHEVGLQIGMDGHVVHVVKDTAVVPAGSKSR